MSHSNLTQLFDTYPDVDNYITFQLSRAVTGDIDGGIFTIGIRRRLFPPARHSLTNTP